MNYGCECDCAPCVSENDCEACSNDNKCQAFEYDYEDGVS